MNIRGTDGIFRAMSAHEPPPLVLASRSPRRREILSRLGVPFDVLVPGVPETDIPGDIRGSALANAVRKNTWCARQRPDSAVIAADTVIEFDGRLIGKPPSMEDARKCLQAFSGREHCVITALALFCPGSGMEELLVESRVRFKRLDAATIDSYLSAVDPLDKAGGYDINQHGDIIIAGYSGSWTNIMGLPVEPVAGWLRRMGHSRLSEFQDRALSGEALN